MIRVPLSDGWLVASSREVLRGQPYETGYRPIGWLAVHVPQTIQAALVEHGCVPSPWRDRNVEAFREFEEDTWWYRLEFEVPADARDAQRYELLFEGVSIFAAAWLNGTPIGYMRNAHHAHRFDVTDVIDPDGRNVLAVECSLGLPWLRRSVRTDISKSADEIKPYARAPQMMFGWDFAPRLPVIGLWRPVSLLCHRAASIEDINVRTLSLDGDGAELQIESHVRGSAGQTKPLTLLLTIADRPDGPAVWEKRIKITPGVAACTRLKLGSPRPWYPQHAGEPFLYTLTVRLLQGDAETDRRAIRFGVRTIKLKQDGQFTFSINGEDVFAKGANWVPPDSLALDATPERYRHLLELARDAGFTMLRVWGGGTYESDLFYELCDELGIMVWQDFMYACSMYPDDDPAFMESAEREAREAVRRLRGHPCLVLWCGNNECQEAWALGDWPQRAPRHLGERLYDHVLPKTVRAINPDVPYWPGSPYGGPTTRSREIGDFHDWYSLPNWRSYDDNAPRFSSEYGFRSVPQRETVDEMISPELQWDPHGPQHVAWQFHHGWCGWLQAILPEFGSPQTLDEYIMLTQEAQATLMRYAAEIYRRRMYATSGSLIWQYDEPWPAVTFSLIDYYGRPKAAYYWVKRAYAPVLGMFYAKDGKTSYWAISDLRKPCNYHARLRRFSHEGKLLGGKEIKGVLLPNRATQLLDELPSELLVGNERGEFLHAELSAANSVSERFYHTGHRRDWQLPQVEIEARVRRRGAGSLAVSLAASGYAHFVSATVPDPLARYSDNYVDLLRGETREIVIQTRRRGPVTLRAANARTRIIR